MTSAGSHAMVVIGYSEARGAFPIDEQLGQRMGNGWIYLD